MGVVGGLVVVVVSPTDGAPVPFVTISCNSDGNTG